MKKILLYMVVLLSFTIISCEETIEELDFSDESKMFVYGILNNYDSVNYVFCYSVRNNKLTSIEDAQINLYINGVLSETTDNCVHDSNNKVVYYKILSKFNSGDKVRIEVSSPSINSSVWAESEVPQPIDITQVDTLQSFIPYDDYFISHYKVNLNLYSPEKIGNYRINSGLEMNFCLGYANIDENTMEIISERDSIVIVKYNSVKIKDDLALTDGKGFVQNEDDDAIGMDVYYYNHFRIIPGTYFNNNQYNVSYYVKIDGYWSYDPILKSAYQYGGEASWQKNRYWRYIYKSVYIEDEYFGGYYYDDITNYVLYKKEYTYNIFYQVFSMSDEEYTYLRNRSNQIDIDWSASELVEPISLKGNINGGLGIFAIENVTEGKIQIPILDPIPSSFLY
ncbi:MAG: DUF4249 domain-containing protein [Bacteroidales bacterium]|nr:DUF4249 domain-containing protein [Bacteroidales bacterium]